MLAACNKPKIAAVNAPSVEPSCPEGYMLLSKHEGGAGALHGHGFVIVPYVNQGKQMHLVCTQNDGKEDARINRPVSKSIPESK